MGLKDSSCVEDSEEMYDSIQFKDFETYFFFQDKNRNHSLSRKW